MNIFIFIFFFIGVVPKLSLGQEVKSPYMGQESRQIKALFYDEIQGYLSGRGMGFAKSAELNHYPGPKHVLELSAELDVTPQQKQQTEAIFQEMHEQAVRLGKTYIEREQGLEQLFNDRTVSAKSLKDHLDEIGSILSQLRFVHLNAHLKMADLLSAKQIERYDEIRGYRRHQSHERHEGHH